MERDDFLEDPRETESAQRPSIALVQEGVLVGDYSADQAEEADRATTRLTLTRGRHVTVYQIDPRLPPPPPLGTPVDPATLGWVDVG